MTRLLGIAAALVLSLLNSTVAAAQAGEDACADLEREVSQRGMALPREERLVAVCPNRTRLLRFSRAAGPWELLARAGLSKQSVAPLHAIRYRTSVSYNSERPSSAELPGVWAGRGLTVAASAGAWGRIGPVSYAARPVVFWTENRAYTPSRSRVPIGFQNPWFPAVIDAPYRFGPDTYGRVDVGESFARLDIFRFAAGVSNVAQSWGPAQLHPMVLGQQTGFPHVFLESALPLNVGIGAISGRWIMGRLSATSFAPAHSNGKRRVLVGTVGAFSPRGIDGLEIGGARLFTFYESVGGFTISNSLLPLSGLLKTSSRQDFESNQIASVFARLALPSAPLEVYGEYYRDDHNSDLRDLIAEPDHAAAWVLGMSWRRHDALRNRISVLTLERVNSRATHLRRLRQQLPLYTHHHVVEGHAHRGLILGSRSVPGGGALSAVFDRRHGLSGWSVIAEVVHDAQGPAEGATWLGKPAGHYTIGVAREKKWKDHWYTIDARLQPGFGDVPGTNLRLTFGLDGALSAASARARSP